MEDKLIAWFLDVLESPEDLREVCGKLRLAKDFMAKAEYSFEKKKIAAILMGVEEDA